MKRTLLVLICVVVLLSSVVLVSADSVILRPDNDGLDSQWVGEGFMCPSPPDAPCIWEDVADNDTGRIGTNATANSTFTLNDTGFTGNTYDNVTFYYNLDAVNNPWDLRPYIKFTNGSEYDLTGGGAAIPVIPVGEYTILPFILHSIPGNGTNFTDDVLNNEILVGIRGENFVGGAYGKATQIWLNASFEFVTPDTSVYAKNLTIPDLSFSDTNYVSIGTIFFNTTEDNVNMTIYNAMNLEKVLGGGSNIITGRIILDNVIVIEQNLISIENANEVTVAGFKPFLVNITAGEHNFTIDLKRSGLGNIEVTDIDVVLEKFVSAHNNTIFAEVENETLTFDYGTYTAIESGSYALPVSAPMLNIIQFLVNASINSVNLDLFSQNNDTLVQLAGLERGVPSSTGFGSTTTVGIDTNETAFYNHTIFAKVDPAANLTINGSEIHMALRDSSGNFINYFNDTNKSTNLTNTISLNAGTHRIATALHTLKNGTGIFLIASASMATSSGVTTPTLFVNSSNSTVPSDVCFNKKERYLKTNNESKNVFLYEICGYNLTVGNTYEFNLYLTVPMGRTIVLYDESLTGHEVTSFVTASEVDSTPPNITIEPPSQYNMTVNLSGFFVNISLSEAGVGAWVEVNGTNYSMTQGVNNTLWYVNITGLADGNYTWVAYARDQVGNDAVTGESWIFVSSHFVSMDSRFLLVEIYIVFSLMAIFLFVIGALMLERFDRGIFLLALALLFFVMVAFYSFAIVKFGIGDAAVLTETFTFFTLGVFYSFMILLTIALIIFYTVYAGVKVVGNDRL